MKFYHPKALSILFLTEMWERFGFYIVQGLLVLYMSNYFGYSDSESYTILGVFTALAYISPLVGGMVANQLLGYKTSIIWGGFFLIAGYALLALPHAHLLFYPALATIVVGNGLFKPNVSSLLGAQYPSQDPRRDAGFTLFYIGINIGAFLAGLSSGYIKNYFGWRMSFGVASVGLVIGLCTFIYGLSSLREPKPIQKRANNNVMFFIYCLIAIFALNILLKIHLLADWLLPIIGIMLFVAFIVLILKQHAKYRRSMLILFILILSSIIFWMLFLQMFYSINLFIDRLVDKNLFSIPLTTTIFYASEGVFIILLGPFFAWSWQLLGEHQQNPSPINKFILGLLCTGIGFLILALSIHFPNAQGLIHPLFIFAAYLLITIGELFISPIGLAAVTQLAPSRLVGLIMGIWFVATGFGGIFAGWLAQLSDVPITVIATADKLHIYQNAFLNYAYLAFFVGLMLLLVRISLNRFLRISRKFARRRA